MLLFLKQNTCGIFYPVLFLLMMRGTVVFGQVGIQTDNPDPSAALDVSAQNKGLLVPRITLDINLSDPSPVTAPATGLIVYNQGDNQEHGFYYWTGTTWKMLKPVKETDMRGPDSSTDNAVARFDGTDGNLLQNSPVILDDNGSLTGINKLTTSAFAMPTGASDGKVLAGDASGNAFWADPFFPDVKEDDVPILENAQILNFKGAVEVTDDGGNQATIAVSENISVEKVIQVSASQSLDLNVFGEPVAIGWDTEHFKDVDCFSHSNLILPSRVTVLKDGTYEINYMFSFDNTNNKRKTIRSRVKVNDLTIDEHSTAYGFIYSSTDDKASLVSSSFLINLTAGDFVEIVVNGQTNEGAVNLIENENLFYVRALRTW